MKKEGEIRWIQLSDLHMFNTTEVTRQRKSLSDTFHNNIDFIIITGDLHQFGTDYKLSQTFLSELVQELHIKEKDVIIVPGNHDITPVKGRKEALNEIDHNIENNPDVYTKELPKLYQAFRNYKKFLQNFYGKDIAAEELLKNNLTIWEEQISILCINTALASDENHFKPQIIDINGLDKLENPGLPCIAAMHHDYYSISDMHKPYIKTKFRELKVSAVLSGHKHKYSRNIIDLGNNNIVPDFCCAKSVSQPEDLWSDVGVIEYRWQLKENNVKVIPYGWDSNNLVFVPTVKFENPESIEVGGDGHIILKQSFAFKTAENRHDLLKKEITEKEIIPAAPKYDFEKFTSEIQVQYLDGILKRIGDDETKYQQAVDIMERIITYEGKKLNFTQIADAIISCKNKVVLAINGLQGTGKSTFLSLIYYKLKLKFNQTKVFPVLIDLHTLDNYSRTKAKNILNNHLKKIRELINMHQEIKFILMFDGADDYIRKTSNLEENVYRYVEKSNMSNFAFCIGSADNLPDDMCKTSRLKSFSREAIYKLEANKIKKNDNKNITAIIKDLIEIYSFSIKPDEVNNIKNMINVYTINEIDYRTLLIILRVFAVNINHRVQNQLGNYFYEYYLMEMDSDVNDLYKHAEAAYRFVIQKERDALRSLKHTKIIYNNGITIDFLLAYYFICLIKNNGSNLSKVLNSEFVFTASVNKFIKDLISNKFRNEQYEIAEKLIQAYKQSNISMQSQICYILGRFQKSNAKSKARDFLITKWDSIYNDLFINDILTTKQPDPKNDLVLFRTISVSLTRLGYGKKQEKFLRCLLLNEKLNDINRGFHLEYYEDKAYMNGVSPTYVDDSDTVTVNKTMNFLIDSIKKGFSKPGKFDKSIYMDIVTLFSIYQYRMDNTEIKDQYKNKLKKLAEKILLSSEIQSKTVINYITTIKELLDKNAYKKIIEDVCLAKTTVREGWVRRKINRAESIADHMYACYTLADYFLPDNIYQCIDYDIPDIENYATYSKDTVKQMLSMHDQAEVKTGDIIATEKVHKDIEEENKYFDSCEYLCSFPCIYGLGNRKKLWDEFVGNTSINAKVANDVDKIEALAQAYFYKQKGEKIDLNEWKEYARKTVNTSLGKQLLHLVIDKVLD